MKDGKFESNEKLSVFMLESSKELSDLMQNLANDKRVQILANLVYEKQSLSELQERTGFAASLLGNHLGILIDSGLVKKFGRGLYDISMNGLDLVQQISEVFLDMKIREKQRLEYLQALVDRFTDPKAIEGETMSKQNDIQVRIVELKPFFYVSFHGLGTQPEDEAFSKMAAWVKQEELIDDMSNHPVYGFNNPDPQEGKAEYGYEVWVVVDPDEIDDPDKEIKSYAGGKYAVTTTKLFPLNPDNVIPAWPRLVKWAQNNNYELATHQWLEKSLAPFAPPEEVYLDLYLPIK